MKYIVECKPDRCLIETLLKVPKKHIDHRGNKPEAIKKLLKTEDAIGIIDEDPGSPQPSDLKKFKLKEDCSQWGLLYCIEQSSKKKLIIIRPRLEEWLLKAGKESGISFKKYNLPETGDKLHKLINANLNKLELIIKELLEADSLRLKKLGQFLRS